MSRHKKSCGHKHLVKECLECHRFVAHIIDDTPLDRLYFAKNFQQIYELCERFRILERLVEDGQ